jgi:hypothetical protein
MFCLRNRFIARKIIYMNNCGWIKIHRQILEWEWYSDNNCFRLFLHLLLKANHKEKRFKGIELKVGSIVTSRDLLAYETGLSSQQIRTALNKLILTNEITSKTSTQGTILQIVNYQKYQIITNEITNDEPTNNQRITTNKNVNKEKKEIQIPTLEDFINYAVSKIYNINKDDVSLKYMSWLENDWSTNVNGKQRKITNWKSTLLNTLPYIRKDELKTYKPNIIHE